MAHGKQVAIPISVHQGVEAALQEHLERKELFESKSQINKIVTENIDSTMISDSAYSEDPFPVLRINTPVEELSMPNNSLLDDVLLLKRSMHLRERQQARQVWSFITHTSYDEDCWNYDMISNND